MQVFFYIASDPVLERGKGSVIAGILQTLHARFGEILDSARGAVRRVDKFDVGVLVHSGEAGFREIRKAAGHPGTAIKES